jgi:two-component system LytT family response regulator
MTNRWCGSVCAPCWPTIIIFVTAFDQFALEAFRLHALDYLTKPIDPERFAECLDRVRELHRLANRDSLEQRIQAVIEMHERRRLVKPHLVVREDERYLLVPTSGIHCLEATGNYVRLYCERTHHLLRGTLTAVEAKLDPQRFLRVHRSWIVNLDYVREAQFWSKGTWILLTLGGLQIPVGEQYRDALRKILE